MPTTLTPYLSFRGNTREAFAFYAQALGAEIQAMLRFADMPAPPAGDDGCAGGPPPGADGAGDGIMHACLALPGGALLMAGDVPPGMPFDGMKGVMLALQCDTEVEAQRIFAALAEGGSITMPLAPAPWARIFGMLTDRHGVSWAINGVPVPMG
jgi:PhnB protein